MFYEEPARDDYERQLYEQQHRPTDEELCGGGGHPYYGDEADCEDGRLHGAGEPCWCGRCYCGERRYHRGGGPVQEPPAHAVRWDRAGRKPKPRSKLRLTCRSCLHATLVAQPYMDQQTWDGLVAAFMVEHPARHIPCADPGGDTLVWDGQQLTREAL